MTPPVQPGGAPPRSRHAARSPFSGVPTAVWVTLAVVAVLLLAVAGTLIADNRPRALDWGERGYQITPGQITLTFDVTKAPLAQARCTLRALGSDGTEVGRTDVTIGPRSDSRRLTLVSTPITTSAAAVTASVESCRITRTR